MVVDGEVEAGVGLAEDAEDVVPQQDTAFLLTPQVGPGRVEDAIDAVSEAGGIAAEGVDVEMGVGICGEDLLQVHGAASHHSSRSIALDRALRSRALRSRAPDTVCVNLKRLFCSKSGNYPIFYIVGNFTPKTNKR
jgi:hypothetical protein